MNKNSKDIRKRAQSRNQQQRGRPAQIQEVTLNPQDIWTNAAQFKPLQLLCFLHSIGRHYCPHLAGQHGKKIQAKEEKLRANKEQQVFYDCVEAISHKYFDHQNTEKRCFPFFFRIPRSPKFDLTTQDLQVYGEKGQILSYVLGQLNHKFIGELVDILNSEQSDVEMAQKFLKQSQQVQIRRQIMKDFSEIAQNAYIKFILNDMITRGQDYFSLNIDICNSFQQYIQSEQALYTIMDWVSTIRSIMNYEQQQMLSPFGQVDVGFMNDE